jgi:hypothetical protein
MAGLKSHNQRLSLQLWVGGSERVLIAGFPMPRQDSRMQQ